MAYITVPPHSAPEGWGLHKPIAKDRNTQTSEADFWASARQVEPKHIRWWLLTWRKAASSLSGEGLFTIRFRINPTIHREHWLWGVTAHPWGYQRSLCPFKGIRDPLPLTVSTPKWDKEISLCRAEKTLPAEARGPCMWEMWSAKTFLLLHLGCWFKFKSTTI